MALNDNALTTLAAAKRVLNIGPDDDTHDTLLEQLINSVSDKIEQYCSRAFHAADYKSVVRTNYSGAVVLDNPPIQYIERIGLGARTFLTVKNDVDLRALISVQDDSLIITTTSQAGAVSQVELLFDDYPTTTDLVDAINAIGSSPNYIATLQLHAPSEDLWPAAGMNCATGSQSLYGVSDTTSGIHWDLNADIGAISHTGSPIGVNKMMVWYHGGYESIPPSLSQICAEITKIAYSMVKIDPALSTRTELSADTTLQLGTRAFDQLEDTQKKLLDHFVDVDIAINAW